MSQALILAHAVNNILSQYIEIHDDIFKISLRKVIPIPGIFKSIDFSSHHKKLIELHSDIWKIHGSVLDLITDSKLPTPETQFLEILEVYIMALTETIDKLAKICNKLNLKANRLLVYDKNEYQYDVDEYNISVQNYLSIGNSLNNILSYIT
jgi:hypothetical protein